MLPRASDVRDRQMKVEITHHIDASEPNAQGVYDYYYEYDDYTFTDGDAVLVARSYTDEPHRASLRVKLRDGQRQGLTAADLRTPFVQAVEAWFRAAGKTSIQWLGGGGKGYVETNSTRSIRQIRPGDEDEIAYLLEDHERHYGFPVREGSGAEGAAFIVKGGALCLVAEYDGGRGLVGFAILNPYFPGPRLTHGLFLKELYVSKAVRSSGVGETLIEAIRQLAKERGDARVIWTTGVENKGSQRFYDRLGIRREDKVYYVMDV